MHWPCTVYDVPAAMKVLDGPRVTHYWNESGDLGNDFSEVLDIVGTYAWDVWLIYPPDTLWANRLAPEPDYWMHQLRVDRGHFFDAPAFAAETSRLIDQVQL